MSDVNDLFDRAMTGLDDDNWTPTETPTGRSAMVCLQRIASREVLEIALACSADASSLRRRIGAAILGQLGHSKPDFAPVFFEERFTGLMTLLAVEHSGAADPKVLGDTCIALGHLHDPRAIPALLDLRRHPDAAVRCGVVSGLSGHDAADAIDGLIALSADEDDRVRDWATFALGQQIETDTPAIRTALRARLDDPCIEARNEAIEGLATRGDLSVLPVLIRELTQQVAAPLLNAATALATPELCNALAAAAERGLTWDSASGKIDLTNEWAEAKRACGCG